MQDSSDFGPASDYPRDALRVGMFKNIGHKIITVFGLVASIAMLSMIAFYTYNQEQSILAQNKRTMEKLTESVIEGLQTVMLAGYADIAQNYATRLKRVPEVVDFVILRTNGKEAFLDNSTIDSVNTRIGEEDFIPKDNTRIHQVLPTSDQHLQQVLQEREQISYYETDVNNEQLLTFLAPIKNDKDCHRCHGGDNPIRGVLKLTTSLAPIKQDIAATRSQSMVVLVVMLGLVFVVTSYLIRRSVVQPINKLTDAMLEVSRGDLDQVVPVIGRDELSRMAQSFNHMSREVLNSYKGLKNEQDKLNTILLSSLEGIVVTDSNGDVVLVNPAAEVLLDKSSEEIRVGGFLNLLDDPELVKHNLCKDPSQLEPVLVEYKNRILQMLASSILAPTGEAIGSAILLRDITEEKKLENQLRELSTTDALTKLYNRRHLDETLDVELKRARRYKLDLSVLMFDVDHFKRFNDEHGHDQGDRVLQHLAGVMRECIREVDVPCRYGGEEFLIILTNTARNGALITAERLREAVEASRIDGLQVTISIGVASYPYLDVEESDEFVERADAALYEAKEQGRNRVWMAH
ncbi:sensor domain-containing diguanylate cyclase [Motiliproteus sediminis]|uniref:sensor domain-containing diguanylate cyclase n=1 Tax=Motiliproteus sediminis TaxID=1468178 RepID=UPI001AEF8233|nr:diguanylate cyclase [Motiliproteus sediminis]